MSTTDSFQGPFLDSVQGFISPKLVEQISQFLGESPSTILKGIGVAIPAVLAEIAQKGSSKQGAKQIASYLHDEKFTQPITVSEVEKEIREVSSDPSIGRTGGALDNLLGGQLNLTSQTVSNVSGMTSTATTSLLATVSTIAMGLLGRKFSGAGVRTSEIQNYLIDQKPSIFSALPQGLKSLMDFSVTGAGAETFNRPRIWPWLVALLALLILGGVWLSGLNRVENVDTPAPAKAVVDPTPAKTVVQSAPAPLVMKGTSDNLQTFLQNGASTELPKRFRFDDLNFTFATATLIPGSQGIVEKIAQVMIGFPSAKILLEGHTDSIGNPEENMKLSYNRAQAVKAFLVNRGVAADRIEVSGKGASEPFAANDSETNRLLNRRIELIVTAK